MLLRGLFCFPKPKTEVMYPGPVIVIACTKDFLVKLFSTLEWTKTVMHAAPEWGLAVVD